MTADCDHRWSAWTLPVAVRDYQGQPIDPTRFLLTATLSGGEPATPGWTRRCGLCRQKETT